MVCVYVCVMCVVYESTYRVDPHPTINQSTIQSMNTQVAVCNLASVNLSAFVVEEPGQKPTYDLQKLYEITKVRACVCVWGCVVCFVK